MTSSLGAAHMVVGCAGISWHSTHQQGSCASHEGGYCLFLSRLAHSSNVRPRIELSNELSKSYYGYLSQLNCIVTQVLNSLDFYILSISLQRYVQSYQEEIYHPLQVVCHNSKVADMHTYAVAYTHTII